LKRRISVAVTVLLFVIPGVLFAASNGASASTSACLSSPSAVNCTGGGPAATGCATGAYVAEEVIGYDGTAGGGKVADSWVKLWYSPACRSTWAQGYSEIFPPDASYLTGGTSLLVYVEIKSGSQAGWEESCGMFDNYQASYNGYECSTALAYDGGVTTKAYAQVYHSWYAEDQELITAAY
jgi:hypothetical protein